jgi:hypothetical protein
MMEPHGGLTEVETMATEPMTAGMARLAPAVLAEVEQLATLTEQAEWLRRMAAAVRADADAACAVLVAETEAREAMVTEVAVWPSETVQVARRAA